MTSDLVLVEKSEQIAKITLNHPETLNSLTYDMLGELRQVVEDVAGDMDVRAVLLTGSGRGFCSGANIIGSSGERLASGGMGLRSVVMEMNEVLAQIAEMEKPWVAAVNGPAVGGGCALALICDLVLAADSAYLCVGYVNLGLVLDMGSSYLLPRLAGRHQANALAFFGESIPAPKAAEMGLINDALPDGQLMDAARALALRLAQGPTLAIGAMKTLLRQAQNGDIREAMQREVNLLSLISQTEDAAEGLMAFFQKRKAEFKGR